MPIIAKLPFTTHVSSNQSRKINKQQDAYKIRFIGIEDINPCYVVHIA
jgi:hypothetical protein